MGNVKKLKQKAHVPGRKPKKMVPGWGGSIGRVAKVVRGYTTKGGIAYRALSLAKRVADAVNIEYKEVDSTNFVAPDYNGTVVDLTSIIAQGSANGQRIGDSLKLQRLTFRCYTIAGANTERLRFIIYIDKQNTITTGAQMLQNSGNAYAVVAPKLEDNKYQTQILVDRVFDMIPNTTKAINSYEFTQPINLHCHYTGGTTTVKDNALKILFISTSATASTGTIYYTTELSYTDD